MGMSIQVTRVTGIRFDRPHPYTVGSGLDQKGGWRSMTLLIGDGRQEVFTIHADDMQALRLPGENSEFELAPEPMPTDDILEESPTE